MIFTLDTSIVVDALRRPAELDRLKTFLCWALPSTVLSTLLCSLRAARAYPCVWRRAAQARGEASGSAFNDALLACQAREHGWTIRFRRASELGE